MLLSRCSAPERDPHITSEHSTIARLRKLTHKSSSFLLILTCVQYQWKVSPQTMQRVTMCPHAYDILLLRGCKTWTCYSSHLKNLDQFPFQHSGQRFMNQITNRDVLRSLNLSDVEAMITITKAWLCWTAYLVGSLMYTGMIVAFHVIFQTLGQNC